MLRIYYEEYYNDYHRKDLNRSFSTLKELENWIFGQMQQDYSDKENGWTKMYFPRKEPTQFEFTPKRGGPSIWIHRIDNEHGIVFSDGRFTGGKKHWSSEIRQWLKQCHERQYNPHFNFVD